MQGSNIKNQPNHINLFISPTFRELKYFVIRDKRYPFDFDIFNKNSKFFVKNQNQYENVECIELFNESESDIFINITDKAITDFISLMQNKECQIDISDISYIQYLSKKFEADTLTKSISNLIISNKNQLELDNILFKLEQNNDNFHISHEDIYAIANNLINFINDERMVKLPIQILSNYYPILFRFL